MDIQDVIMKYDKARSIPEDDAARVDALFDLEDAFAACKTNSCLNLCYGYLSDQSDWDVYTSCRVALAKMPGAENFILEKLGAETNPHLLGDCIHLLGRLKSAHAITFATNHLADQDEYVRMVCLYVLGWMGKGESIPILERHMTHEASDQLRITAASALRQIAGRRLELKDSVLKALARGFMDEKNDEAIKWIVVMLGTVAIKNLGLREDRSDPKLVHGDLAKAKVKAHKFATSILAQ